MNTPPTSFSRRSLEDMLMPIGSQISAEIPSAEGWEIRIFLDGRVFELRGLLLPKSTRPPAAAPGEPGGALGVALKALRDAGDRGLTLEDLLTAVRDQGHFIQPKSLSVALSKYKRGTVERGHRPPLKVARDQAGSRWIYVRTAEPNLSREREMQPSART